MSVRNLRHLFEPASVAVIGASNRPRSVGAVIMRNLLAGAFEGPIMPVHPAYRAVAGVLTYPDVASLPITPDLAVVCTPPETVPGIVEELGRRGVRAAVIIAGGLERRTDAEGRTLRQAMMSAAKTHGVSLLGTSSLGLLVPKVKLNASFSHVEALPGNVAFVSQSGALCTAILDWAHPKGIGFSHFVSLGDCDDVDFGEVLDYLANDVDTRAILLYIESIGERRNFMAAARSAARNKPVLAIKAGRVPEANEDIEAAATHSGALARADEVFDAALRRAGILRVDNIDELFAAVETLARGRTVRGPRLAVMANGGGAGVMAMDALIAGGVDPAPLSAETVAKLDAILPATWTRRNPVDVFVDASGQRYADTLKVLLADRQVDAVLAIHAPTAIASSDEAAEAVIATAKSQGSGKLLTSWVGAEAVTSARRRFADAGIPTYETPGRAVRAFLHLLNHGRNQEMLMQTPPSLPTEFRPATGTVRLIVERALDQNGGVMTEPDAKAVLAAYGIPVVETSIAADAAEAAAIARRIGFPIALTILSPDIARKWDVGGIALNLESPAAVLAAAEGMLGRVRERRPGAAIQGFTVQRMVPRTNARQIIIGVTTDPLFGPVILFGEGGRAVEVIRDHAVGLPPLNMPLARDLISRTRIWKLLHAYHERPAADIDALCLTLIKVSQLVVDIPEIVGLDINPLFADDRGVIAVDAHMQVARPATRESRLAILPYPKALEEPARLRDGRLVLLRPIRPEDEPAHHALIARMTAEDIRFRFFNYVRELKHSQMARLTQIDYDREMAFIATTEGENGQQETLGVVRTVTDPDNICAEFAVLVRSDLKGQGLGTLLMDKMIRYSRSRKTQGIRGEVLAENQGMLALAQRLGFDAKTLPGGDTIEVRLRLN
ncbi:MAG: bifunctional acetate--CoA ligase family protein/GNAT family N-acetyltransferase [Rhodospirillales bacterium]|nr:bifunctional acetate--CoA ligase family protein/GNAT family N-acetyltransferase [Rhodospirillales bacterium]